MSYFYHDWIRGKGVDDEASFNVVLTRKNEDLPYKNRLKFLKIVAWPLNIVKRFFRYLVGYIRRMLPRPIKQVIKNLYEYHLRSKRIIKNCRVCDAVDLEPVIDFGYHPWCGHFLKEEEIGKEPYYPLKVVYCLKCATPQLTYTVPKEVMFAEHTYLSNITKTLSDHFKSIAEEIDNRFFKNLSGKSVLDIGSNDGLQLSHYKSLGYDVLGVESAKTVAKIANESGIPTANEFFNLDFAREARQEIQRRKRLRRSFSSGRIAFGYRRNSGSAN